MNTAMRIIVGLGAFAEREKQRHKEQMEWLGRVHAIYDRLDEKGQELALQFLDLLLEIQESIREETA